LAIDTETVYLLAAYAFGLGAVGMDSLPATNTAVSGTPPDQVGVAGGLSSPEAPGRNYTLDREGPTCGFPATVLALLDGALGAGSAELGMWRARAQGGRGRRKMSGGGGVGELAWRGVEDGLPGAEPVGPSGIREVSTDGCDCDERYAHADGWFVHLRGPRLTSFSVRAVVRGAGGCPARRVSLVFLFS